MTNESFFPPTVEALSQALLDLKNRVLARIALHFTTHPWPVNEPDNGSDAGNRLQLLDYWVTTANQDKAFIMELRADGFTFEDWEDESGTGQYDTLDVEVLIDLVRVLDKAAESAEIGWLKEGL